MLDPHKLQAEKERVDHARRLGGFDKSCKVCGEANPCCLQLHHLAGKDYGDELVCLCGNCHSKVTDKKANKPAPEYPSKLDQIGHWLIGLATLLFEIALKAFEYGSLLIEAGKACPSPYGYVAGVTL